MGLEEKQWLEQLLQPEEAAKFLCVTPKWLERGRYEGYGPKFVRLSQRNIAYQRKALIQFRDEHVYSSSSEYSSRRPSTQSTGTEGAETASASTTPSESDS